MPSPAEHDFFLWIVIPEVIGRNVDVQTLVDVSEVLVSKRRLVILLVSQYKNLPAVFGRYDVRSRLIRLRQDSQLRVLKNVALSDFCMS